MGQGAVAAGIYAVLTVPGAEDDPRPAILIAAPAQPAAEQPATPLDQPAEQPADHGLFTEALMAGIAQDAPAAKERVRAFLEGRAGKVKRD